MWMQIYGYKFIDIFGTLRMPKGKRKYKSGGLLRQKQDPNFASEEESFADNSSIVSNLSELRVDSDDDTLIEADDEIVTTDDFEDKLKEAIEGTLQKSAKTRINSLEVIRKSLSSKYMFDFIIDRKVTMCDVVERSLKRGKGEEQILGAIVAALICTQLGSVEESETVFQTIQPILLILLSDPVIPPAVRAQVIQSTMESLHSVFSASFFKGNGVAPTHKPEISSLHSSALLAWNLLLTVLSPPYIMDLVNTHLKKLPQLLDSIDVDLRIAAGETLAVFYELIRQCREDFEDDIDSLCDKLRLLATDSQKFRAKKDRRQQRSSFRDILRAIEEREPLDIRVKIGKEVLYIDNWCHKRQYDAFCQILGSGMNLHLKQNELLRDIFELGAPIIEENPFTKKSKLQRHSAHLAACKARTKCLSKLRDKRADVMC
ncbi:interferon-related developmental regulator 2-like isoform X2 [Stegodyphus dumicola]|uniref:interferon-related developmental regulator 2-like isoform X2 n=1 Tax=Stegodyphus dumicola TaxID=202533 RepID=UPI0015A85366|nr:interferon-related developmental regulator 2-like isoform X2 [Stegodyphus dumicola]